jgi:hypothetical protein
MPPNIPRAPPSAPPESPAAAFSVGPAAPDRAAPVPAAPAPATAVFAPADRAARPVMTATVKARPGRLRRNVSPTSSATRSRSIPRPRDSRCLAASSLSSSAAATSATDCCSRWKRTSASRYVSGICSSVCHTRDSISRVAASSAGPRVGVDGSATASKGAAASAARDARRRALFPRFRAIPQSQDRRLPACSSAARPRHAAQKVSWAMSSLSVKSPQELYATAQTSDWCRFTTASNAGALP